ncbi:hypothetical protein B0H66DRAFT_169402 [Apodospora peruviana]|uniref:Uncharacterized protein n=1 Tax=Apodospora peruviana TaxID=516989 RepID=A0AAE0IKE4_9PEZI|nr:hypothetical protein B0H66DRAFT_169402 [Apodospora peruviana]
MTKYYQAQANIVAMENTSNPMNEGESLGSNARGDNSNNNRREAHTPFMLRHASATHSLCREPARVFELAFATPSAAHSEAAQAGPCNSPQVGFTQVCVCRASILQEPLSINYPAFFHDMSQPPSLTAISWFTRRSFGNFDVVNVSRRGRPSPQISTCWGKESHSADFLSLSPVSFCPTRPISAYTSGWWYQNRQLEDIERRVTAQEGDSPIGMTWSSPPSPGPSARSGGQPSCVWCLHSEPRTQGWMGARRIRSRYGLGLTSTASLFLPHVSPPIQPLSSVWSGATPCPGPGRTRCPPVLHARCHEYRAQVSE